MCFRNHHFPLSVSGLIAIAGVRLSACSLDGYEPEKPFTTCPPSPPALVALDASGTSSVPSILFTVNDIDWFDVNTRELKFKDMQEPLSERLRILGEMVFCLGNDTLFEGITIVSPICSQIFDDLVLYCERKEGDFADDTRYYLNDCYPLQFLNDERVQANRTRRTEQWAAFTKYLESMGRLRKKLK